MSEKLTQEQHTLEKLNLLNWWLKNNTGNPPEIASTKNTQNHNLTDDKGNLGAARVFRTWPQTNFETGEREIAMGNKHQRQSSTRHRSKDTR
jgi:hypothetical protein